MTSISDSLLKVRLCASHMVIKWFFFGVLGDLLSPQGAP